jgi:hypothetical protein
MKKQFVVIVTTSFNDQFYQQTHSDRELYRTTTESDAMAWIKENPLRVPELEYYIRIVYKWEDDAEKEDDAQEEG